MVGNRNILARSAKPFQAIFFAPLGRWVGQRNTVATERLSLATPYRSKTIVAGKSLCRARRCKSAMTWSAFAIGSAMSALGNQGVSQASAQKPIKPDSDV
jgi:hypothetical protein